jgi:hypothetical protein
MIFSAKIGKIVIPKGLFCLNWSFLKGEVTREIHYFRAITKCTVYTVFLYLYGFVCRYMEVPLKSGQPAQLQVEKFFLFSVFIFEKETSVLSTQI